jgi:hypothetical protein
LVICVWDGGIEAARVGGDGDSFGLAARAAAEIFGGGGGVMNGGVPSLACHLLNGARCTRIEEAEGMK